MVNDEYLKLLLRHSVLIKIKIVDMGYIQRNEALQVQQQLKEMELKLPVCDIIQTTKYAFSR